MNLSGHRVLVIVGCILALFVVFVAFEILFIKYNGSPVAVPQIPRAAETYGAGKPLKYVILGDSTGVGQGGEYDRGIARTTARHLARNHMVTFQNFAISGAQAADVAGKQVPDAAKLRPDVVLITVGANDVTHLTSPGKVRGSLLEIIAALRQANPEVAVVLTGSPQMGTVPRFAQPVRYLAQVRTRQVNTMVRSLADSEKVVFAPLADRTGPIFKAHPELFAVDKFHPTSDGYDVWKPVLTEALDTAIAQAGI